MTKNPMITDAELDTVLAIEADRRVADRAHHAFDSAVFDWAEQQRINGGDDMPARARAMRRRVPRWALVSGGVFALVCLGAPLAATAVATWTAHTGTYGGPGTETDQSAEWIGLDAEDAPQAIANLYPSYLDLPPEIDEQTVKGIVGRVWGGFGGTPAGAGHSTIPDTVIQTTYDTVARCAWYRHWLSADSDSDRIATATAVQALERAATWPATVSTDGGGIAGSLKSIATSARDGDRSEVVDAYEVDQCAGLTGSVAGD